MSGKREESSRRVQKKRTGIRQRGFTLYELVIAILVISVLAAVLLTRLQYYQQYAEKTAMEVTVRNMRNGLRQQVADLMMQDKMDEAGKLLQQNPIAWLDKPPPNYLGELTAPLEDTLPSASWYFDLSSRELVYVPGSHLLFFDHVANAEKPVRYRVTATIHRPEIKTDSPWKVEGLSLVLANQ